MDLRKLRNEQVSEVIRQKKMMRAALPYILPFLFITSIAGAIFGFYKHYKFKQMQKAPIKIYKTVSPSIQEKRARVKASVSPSVLTTDTETSSQTRLHSTPADTDVKENNDQLLENQIPVPSTDSASAASQPNSGKQTPATDEEARKAAEMLEAKKAEVDRMLKEGEQLSDQAQNTMNQAAPILVKHLNSLSREEQREFLNQVRTQMISQFPPEVRELFDNDPELEKKAWQNFLDLLHTHGFDAPD